MNLYASDALIVVDLQNDFVTGSLAVPGAQEILPNVHQAVKLFEDQQPPIYFTQCWHPENHCSFEAQGGKWPPHCIADTYGAELVAAMDWNTHQHIYKGTSANKDAYSGFDGTTLETQLRQWDVKRIFVCGLATDYCVRATVLSGIELGFEVMVLTDAIAAVNRKRGDAVKALTDMWTARNKSSPVRARAITVLDWI